MNKNGSKDTGCGADLQCLAHDPLVSAMSGEQSSDSVQFEGTSLLTYRLHHIEHIQTQALNNG